MMLAQSGSVEQAAIEALKQSPGILASLILIVIFVRYITGRDTNDRSERQAVRESHEKLAESVNTLAVVVEGLKEKLKK